MTRLILDVPICQSRRLWNPRTSRRLKTRSLKVQGKSTFAPAALLLMAETLTLLSLAQDVRQTVSASLILTDL